MSGKKISFETLVDSKKVLQYFEDFVSSYRAGKIYIQEGKEYVVLSPAGTIELKMEAKQKDEEEKITIELCWPSRMEQDQEAPFRIGSSLPKDFLQEQPDKRQKAPAKIPEMTTAASSSFKDPAPVLEKKQPEVVLPAVKSKETENNWNKRRK